MHRERWVAAAGALVALVGLGARAAAQPVTTREESDALFGFDRKQPAALSACDDGTDFACAFATDPLAAGSGLFALTTRLTPARWRELAVADSAHDAIVPFALGAARDDGGVFFAGATGLENRWLVEGAPTEALRTGGVDTRVPLVFVESIAVTAGGFGAADRASTGGTVDVRLIRGGDRHEVAAEAWAGASAAAADLPPEPLHYDPITADRVDPRSTSVAVVARGPIARVAGARLWYAAGIRAVVRDDSLDRRRQRLVDANADGVADVDGDRVVITEPIDHLVLHEYAYGVPLLARVGADRGHHAVELTALANVYRIPRWTTLATTSATGIRRTGAIVDGIATWRGTWPRTRARVTASWHRSAYDEDPRIGDRGAVQLQTGFIPLPGDLPEDAGFAAACDDTAGDDPYPDIANCPVIEGLFASGGAGHLTGQTADRPAISADVAHRAGNHTLTAGVAGEDGRLVDRHRLTGGRVDRTLFPGFTDSLRFVERTTGGSGEPCDDDPEVTDRCVTVDEATVTYRTRQLAAYAADEWRPRGDFAFAGGVRWESMELGRAFAFRDQVAPRVGLAWDPLGGGRSRVFAGFGRTYAVMPAGMGESVVGTVPTVEDLDLSGFRSIEYSDGAPTVAVDPDLAPVFAEELAGGAELALRGAVRVTAWGQVRWLRRGIEDEAGTLTNPIDPPATRRSTLVAVELATAPGRRFGVRVQYQLAHSAGAATGPYDPTAGVRLYTGPTYDTGLDGANAAGPLASDLRHRAAIEGTARVRLGAVPVAIGLRAQLTSGRPLNAIAADAVGNQVLLLPRGGAGRLGLVTTTSLHVAADLGHGLELVAEAFNLFDRQRATAVDEVYTTDIVPPIDGGRAEDLVFLKLDDDGAPVTRNAGHGRATARQAPLSAAIGVRARF